MHYAHPDYACPQGITARWVNTPRHRSPRPEGWLLAHGDGFLKGFYIHPDTSWQRCRCGWHMDLGPHYAAPGVACKSANDGLLYDV
jgi:hypothetical protein